MERDMGVRLLCAKPADDQGIGGGGDSHPAERLTVQLPSGTAQPPGEVARLEDVLTPKNLDPELAAALRADASGDPQAATNLGALLEERGDLQGALAAYRRADRRGDVDGAFNLGCLLAEMGEVTAALDALRRADERGDGPAAANLGVLLEGQAELDAALAAYHRADERGDAVGAFNLGLLLAGRGELDGARAAYQRAAERGDADVREQAIQALAAIAPAEPEPEPVEAPPLVQVEDVAPQARSTRRWVLALGLLALVAILVQRRRRRAT